MIQPRAQSTSELDPLAGRELMPRIGVILHIPHASTLIPADERAKLLLSDEDLRAELLRMTDWYVDELFEMGGEAAGTVVFPVSRLVVDPERFTDDAAEPMATRGMGAVYTMTSDGRPLRSSLDAMERQRLLQAYYFPHHAMLNRLAVDAIADHGRCLIVDAHSFPSSPLPCDLDQSPVRPDICIGTDAFHTPEWLPQMATDAFRSLGRRVEPNRPYAGTIVPMSFYRKDARVHSIMVEVNRSLYMDEDTGERSAGFGEVHSKIQSALAAIIAADARQAAISSRPPACRRGAIGCYSGYHCGREAVKKILFICTGNTCRSPMAEGFFNQLARAEAPEWQANSAGLDASGTPAAATCNAITAAREYGVDLSGHRSQRLSQALVDEADLLLTMTAAHKQRVEGRFAGATGKVHTLLEFTDQEGDIDDPYCGSLCDYQDAAEQIRGAVERAVDRLRSEEKSG